MVWQSMNVYHLNKLISWRQTFFGQINPKTTVVFAQFSVTQLLQTVDSCQFKLVIRLKWFRHCCAKSVSLCLLRMLVVCDNLRVLSSTSCSNCLQILLMGICIIVSAVGWTWWDWSLILRTYLLLVLWHCWFGHLTRKNSSDITDNVFVGTLNLAISICLLAAVQGLLLAAFMYSWYGKSYLCRIFLSDVAETTCDKVSWNPIVR